MGTSAQDLAATRAREELRGKKWPCVQKIFTEKESVQGCQVQLQGPPKWRTTGRKDTGSLEDLFCSEIACSYQLREESQREKGRASQGEGVQEVERSLREETLRI